VKIKLIQVGKTKDKWISEGIAEYSKRLTPFARLEVCEVADHSIKFNSDRDTVKRLEAINILKQVSDEDYLILMDETGVERSSLEFKDFLISISDRKQVVFVIGGVFGVAPELFQRANSLMALSRMTFTHRMARLILMEQLYRAMMIKANRSYHI